MPMLSFLIVGATCKKTKVEVLSLIFWQKNYCLKYTMLMQIIYYYDATLHTTCKVTLYVCSCLCYFSCWLSLKSGLIYAFIGPAVFIILVSRNSLVQFLLC